MTPSLSKQAKQFADDLSRLLNNTITDGIKLSAAKLSDDRYTIGRNLSDRNPLDPDLVALTTSKKKAELYLFASHELCLDDTEGAWLMASKTNYAVQVGEAGERNTLFAYDYVRKLDNGYPLAHFHIYGDGGRTYSSIFKSRGRKKDKLRDLHFPVGGLVHDGGGILFRPILEDIIEMLVAEGLVEARPKWDQAIRDGRKRFYESQLRAAVRRFPGVA